MSFSINESEQIVGRDVVSFISSSYPNRTSFMGLPNADKPTTQRVESVSSITTGSRCV